MSLAIIDKYLFSRGFDFLILQWNADTGGFIKDFGEPEVIVNILASHKGYLYSVDETHVVTKWDIGSSQAISRFSSSNAQNIWNPFFSNDTLFLGTNNGLIFLLNASTLKQKKLYQGLQKRLNTLALWKNYALSGGSSEFITVWDYSVNSFDAILRIDTNETALYHLFVKADFLYSGGFIGSAIKWSLPSFEVVLVFKEHGNSITAMTLGEELLFTAGADLGMFQSSITTGLAVNIISGHSMRIDALVTSNSLLFSAGLDTFIKVWDITAGVSVMTYNLAESVGALLVDGQDLIVAGDTGISKFVIATGERKIFLTETFVSYALIANTLLLFTGCEDSKIRIRDLNTLNILEVFQGHTDSITALYLTDSTILFSTGFDGTIKKWNMASRSVAFSFENRGPAVSSLMCASDTLFVGLRNGHIVSYDLITSLARQKVVIHRSSVSSLISTGNYVLSASVHGIIAKHLGYNLEENFVIYNDSSETIRSLQVSKNYFALIYGESIIKSGSLQNIPVSSIEIQSETPLTCLTISTTLILAGTKSGTIFAWDTELGTFNFELNGHNSEVNDLTILTDNLFSASNDGSIIEWSLVDMTGTRTYKRTSSQNLGHLGPVLSISICDRFMISGGFDTTARRWDLKTGKHLDVFYGPMKAVSALLCANGSVFAGSEDFAVYLYEPNFDLKGTTMNFKSVIETSRLRQRVRKIPSARNGDDSSNMNTLIIAISCVALSVGFVFATIYARKRIQQKHVAELSKENGSSTDTSVTVSDLNTFVNSSMGISKHASYEIAPSSIVPEKELASGGGGVIYLARLMDPKLLSKHGETVVQKQVFIKNKLSEEAFYQEIGILVMLSKYPHFCQLIGFTTIPFAIILKYYPRGSLSHWIKQNHYGSKVIVKILHEISAGLNSMHSHSLAHCDIKPQNILIEIQNGLPNCFLTDFGITQILSERVVASKMFLIVSLRGLSVHYAAPEAFTNFRSKKFVRVDYRKYDVFSFACLSYEVLTKNTPWA